MKLKYKGLLLILLISISTFSQKEIENLVKEGIVLHDKGEFDKAIGKYKKALEIDSISPIVNYEIALSYFSKGNYENAIKHSNIILSKSNKYMLEAYMVYGSALDMMGKTKESIDLFKKAIKETEGNYLLYYNLGLNYFKIEDFNNAEENILLALDLNPNHGSSHLMLANIHDNKGNKIQSLLASYYFLFLEPESRRSFDALITLQKNLVGNVTKDENKPNQINISISPDSDSEFSGLELMLSMMIASNSTEMSNQKTKSEMFTENTKSFFKLIGEFKNEKNTGFYWDFYVPFFYDLAKTEHIEAFCMYISQIGNKQSKKWIEENDYKLAKFDSWLQDY